MNQLYVKYIPISPSLLRLPPTLPIPPQSTEIISLCNCSCFPLAIYFTFGSVYMSMLLSQFIPAYPSPSPCPQVHSLVCVFSPVLPLGSSEPFFFFNSIYMCWHMVFVLLFLTYFTLYDRL